jgi:2-dehydro-3-deoxyphosphooctonate aldolase (KDO 8-P synthase)
MEESPLFNLCKSSKPFFVMAGPNVIESEEHALHMAGELLKVSEELGLTLIFKSSFDKANRTSASSFRGPGLQEGLRYGLIIHLTVYCLPLSQDGRVDEAMFSAGY